MTSAVPAGAPDSPASVSGEPPPGTPDSPDPASGEPPPGASLMRTWQTIRSGSPSASHRRSQPNGSHVVPSSAPAWARAAPRTWKQPSSRSGWTSSPFAPSASGNDTSPSASPGRDQTRSRVRNDGPRSIPTPALAR